LNIIVITGEEQAGKTTASILLKNKLKRARIIDLLDLVDLFYKSSLPGNTKKEKLLEYSDNCPDFFRNYISLLSKDFKDNYDYIIVDDAISNRILNILKKDFNALHVNVVRKLSYHIPIYFMKTPLQTELSNCDFVLNNNGKFADLEMEVAKIDGQTKVYSC